MWGGFQPILFKTCIATCKQALSEHVGATWGQFNVLWMVQVSGLWAWPQESSFSAPSGEPSGVLLALFWVLGFTLGGFGRTCFQVAGARPQRHDSWDPPGSCLGYFWRTFARSGVTLGIFGDSIFKSLGYGPRDFILLILLESLWGTFGSLWYHLGPLCEAFGGPVFVSLGHGPRDLIAGYTSISTAGRHLPKYFMVLQT